MFMIGGQRNNNSCEVFDSITRKFTFVISQFYLVNNISPNQTVGVGNKIYFFVNKKNKYVEVQSYNVERKVFGLKTCFNLCNSHGFSCTKLPIC